MQKGGLWYNERNQRISHLRFKISISMTNISEQLQKRIDQNHKKWMKGKKNFLQSKFERYLQAIFCNLYIYSSNCKKKKHVHMIIMRINYALLKTTFNIQFTIFSEYDYIK